MSLITLTSKDSPDAYNFDSYFPQAIKIERHSQVCALKFIHYRDSNYIVNETNNTLLFVLGNGKNDAQREVKLLKGNYTASELATHIASRMNDATQQQQYEWACTYSPGSDEYKISYSSTAAPAVDGGDWEVITINNGTQTITTGATTSLKITTEDEDNIDIDGDFVLVKGIHTNAGTFVSEGMRIIRQDAASANTAVNYEGKIVYAQTGLVRNANSFEDYSSTGQDIWIEGDGDEGGLNVYSWDEDTGVRTLRNIPKLAFQNGSPVDFTLPNKVVNTIFRTKMTLLEGQVMKVVCQLEVSTDGGTTFSDMTTTETDSTGGLYFRTYNDTDSSVAFDGTFFVSSDQDFYDSATATQAKFCTARCPYKPTQSIVMQDDASQDMTRVIFNSGDDDIWLSGVGASDWEFSEYAGPDPTIGFEWEDTVAIQTYYISKLSATPADVLTYNIYAVVGDPPLGTITYDIATGGISSSVAIGGETAWTYTGSSTALPLIKNQGFSEFKVSGVFNAVNRPISKSEGEALDVDTSKIITDVNTSYVGTDISKTSQLFVGRLTQQDINAYKGSPAFLTTSTRDGDIHITIGARDNIYVGTTSTGKQIFSSDQETSTLGRSSTLHVSIPELPCKSYEGGKSNIGKSLAVIPREEFKGNSSQVGRLVYVADFENWIDLSNASDLFINQFKVEIRNEDGTLATDLIPESMLQIKIRRNPDVVQREMMEKVMVDMGRRPVVEQQVAYTGS